jgi:hypothetical protein
MTHASTKSLERLVETGSYRSLQSRLNCTDQKNLKDHLAYTKRLEEALIDMLCVFETKNNNTEPVIKNARQALSGEKGE